MAIVRLKRGDTREDGWRFWNYYKTRINQTPKEFWLPPDKFQVYQIENLKSSQKWYAQNSHKKICKSDPEYKRKWYQANRELLAKQNKERRANDPKRYAQYTKKWRLANREKVRYWASKRRAIQAGATKFDGKSILVIQIYVVASRVSKCLGIPHDVDHIVPLSLGGAHSIENLQVLPSRLNRKKNANFQYALPDCYRTDGKILL